MRRVRRWPPSGRAAPPVLPSLPIPLPQAGQRCQQRRQLPDDQVLQYLQCLRQQHRPLLSLRGPRLGPRLPSGRLALAARVGR